MWSDVALAAGVFLALCDYFDWSAKIEAVLDRARERMPAVAGQIASFLEKVAGPVAVATYVSVFVVFFAAIVVGLSGGTPNAPPTFLGNIMGLGLFALFIAIALNFFSIAQRIVFLILYALLRLLDWPPKGTLASIGILLVGVDLYFRFFG
ncbi:MAG: hypothetical protein AAGH60_02075 [Pseudomonadota bacterium]